MSGLLALRLGAVCLTGAVLAALLRSARPEMEILLTLGVCTAALLALIPAAQETLDFLGQMAAR